MIHVFDNVELRGRYVMNKDYFSYVAIFTYDEDGICIDFPDLPGCCPCADKDNTEMALKNAKEALAMSFSLK